MPASRLHVLARVAPLLTAVAAIACSPEPKYGALPRGWQPLLQNAEARTSLDTTTIVRSMAGTDLWLGFDFAQPAEVPGDAQGRRYSRSEAHLRVDCQSKRVRNLHVRIYDPAGKRLDEITFPEGQPSAAWRSFVEHDFGAAMFDSLCVVLPKAPARQA